MDWKQETLSGIRKRLENAGMRAELKGEIVRFRMEGIGGREEWKAVGETCFIPYAATGDQEEILQIYLTIAQNVDGSLYGKLAPKLLELNEGAMFGRIGLNEYAQLYYQSHIPVVGDDAVLAARTFEFVTYEMFTFLDAFYAYILVLVNEPDKLTLRRYMELMLKEEEGRTLQKGIAGRKDR